MAGQGKYTVPIHGNYQGYYYKRPFASDPRLDLVPPSLLRNARVLDVGCNEGWVTCEIAQSHGARRVVGVDIDATLISQAWRRRRTVWSLQEPQPSDRSHAMDTTASSATTEASSKKRRRDASADRSEDVSSTLLRAEYFPASFEHSFGPLPIVPTNHTASMSSLNDSRFPHNVSFRAADWVADGIPEDKEGWDVIIAFSISKWIHLNSGDAGLRSFFLRALTALRPGGAFILEPQDWASYAKARRMHPTLKEKAKLLELRPDAFPDLLTEIGFAPAQRLSTGGGGDGGFDRILDLYTKLAAEVK